MQDLLYRRCSDLSSLSNRTSIESYFEFGLDRSGLVRKYQEISESLENVMTSLLPGIGVSICAMPGYYDIDDIIMEAEAVSVVFHVGANGVGLLDPGSETNSVDKGAKIDLPFWLSHELCRRRAVSIIVPPCFNQKMKKDVQADAACVDLGTRYPYFYEFGCKIFPLVGDKSIGPFLRHTFASRYKEMLSKSHTASVNAIPKFVLRLSKEEYQMFEAAKSSMVEYKKWRVSHLGLTKSSLLGHKRKTDSQLGPSS